MSPRPPGFAIPSFPSCTWERLSGMFEAVPPMRSRYRILERDHSHFITATTVAWLPIFTTAARCDVLVDAFEYCRQHKSLKLYAWVILDTHFHAIVAAPRLERVLADLKRHTARRIIEQLEAEHCNWLLRQLRSQRAPHKTESQHQVWQEGSHPQAVMSDEIMLQKLEYLHNNPVKRGLVASPEHWRYSSAHDSLPSAAVALQCDQWR